MSLHGPPPWPLTMPGSYGSGLSVGSRIVRAELFLRAMCEKEVHQTLLFIAIIAIIMIMIIHFAIITIIDITFSIQVLCIVSKLGGPWRILV